MSRDHQTTADTLEIGDVITADYYRGGHGTVAGIHRFTTNLREVVVVELGAGRRASYGTDEKIWVANR